jgi:hypothetical protein
LESLQLSTLSNANGRANRKLFLIRLHRTLGHHSVNSVSEPALLGSRRDLFPFQTS